MSNLLACQRCPRLADYRRRQKQRYPDYHCRPVPPNGAQRSRLLIVGLAPGLHGANATGIPFSGDASGQFLYAALHRFGFAGAPAGGSRLIDCRITNAVKCLPPGNRPTTAEIATCNPYLAREIAQLPGDGLLLALGTVAHRAVLRALGLRPVDFRFGHAVEHRLPDGRRLIDSYHCSRYNVNTGRLDRAGFEAVIGRSRELLS